jgi:hypothetical protein
MLEEVSKLLVTRWNGLTISLLQGTALAEKNYKKWPIGLPVCLIFLDMQMILSLSATPSS